PFHGQVYGVALSVRWPGFTLDGGKYQLPSIEMRSSFGASAMTTSFSTAFMGSSQLLPGTTHGTSAIFLQDPDLGRRVDGRDRAEISHEVAREQLLAARGRAHEMPDGAAQPGECGARRGGLRR